MFSIKIELHHVHSKREVKMEWHRTANGTFSHSLCFSLFNSRNVSSITITNEAKENLIMIDWKQQRMQSEYYSRDTIQQQLICLRVAILIWIFIIFHQAERFWIGFKCKKSNLFMEKKHKQLISMQIEFNRYHRWMMNVLRLNVQCARSYQFRFSSIF